MGSPLKFILLNYLLAFDLLLVVSCVLCVHSLSELWFTLTFLSDLICMSLRDTLCNNLCFKLL